MLGKERSMNHNYCLANFHWIYELIALVENAFEKENQNNIFFLC